MTSQRASQQAFFGVSALLFAGSAALTVVWCASMSAMGEMPMPGGWTMSMAWMLMPGQTWPGAAASFVGMWVVMMVAMMLPSLVPMLWRYRQAVARNGHERPPNHRPGTGPGSTGAVCANAATGWMSTERLRETSPGLLSATRLGRLNETPPSLLSGTCLERLNETPPGLLSETCLVRPNETPPSLLSGTCLVWLNETPSSLLSETHLARLTLLVGVGYFFVSTLFGLAAFLLGVALATVEMQQPALARAVPIAIGGVVLVAGALQFTAWKARHLVCCREAPGCGRTLSSDAGTAWRHGLRLGLHCTYCCAGLTTILLVVGVMDLRAMAVVAAAITIERLAPAGERVARAIGAVVVVAGLLLIIRAVGLG